MSRRNDWWASWADDWPDVALAAVVVAGWLLWFVLMMDALRETP